MLCELAVPGLRRSCVNWSDLDESRADDAIAGQVDYFRRRGEVFEWQLLGYDQPADLGHAARPGRFRARRGGSAAVRRDGRACRRTCRRPDGIRLVEVRDAAGVEAATATQEDLVPGSPRRARHVSRMLAGLADDRVALVLALAGDEPVCSAVVAFGPGPDFAGLYTAATRTDWRGRGIYRAIVAYRVRLAAARGFRYLRVETTTMSLPILRGLGFEPVTATTTYVWTPDAPAA